MKLDKFRNLMAGTGMVFLTSFSGASPVDTPQDTQSLQQTIEQQVNAVVNKQYTTSHILSKKVNIKVSVSDNIGADETNSLDEKGAECNLNVAYKADGSIVKLTQNEDVLKMTAPQNALQADYQREFIALHEAAHCEFDTVKNPIRDLSNTNPEFTKKLNYEMGDDLIHSMKNAKGDMSEFSGYSMYLNETFADTLSTIGMLKTYSNDSLSKGEITNKDLKFVINGVIAQRDSSYVDRAAKNILPDDHYTQDALKELIQPENLKKLSTLNTNEELKEFAMNIANSGTQKAIEKTPLNASVYQPANNEQLDHLISHSMNELSKNPNLSSQDLINSYSDVQNGPKTAASDAFVKVFDSWSPSMKDSLKTMSADDLQTKTTNILEQVHKSSDYEDFQSSLTTEKQFRGSLRKQLPRSEYMPLKEADIEQNIEKIKDTFIKTLEPQSTVTPEITLVQTPQVDLSNKVALDLKSDIVPEVNNKELIKNKMLVMRKSALSNNNTSQNKISNTYKMN